MKNTLYFIHNEVIKNTNFDRLAVDDARLMYLADLVISGNIKIKDRQPRRDNFISDNSIIEEITTFDGVVVSRPSKTTNQDRQASEEFIQSQITRYMDNQNNIADSIIDSVALELRGLYPNLSEEQSVDWALEFVNSDDDCEYIFNRLSNLYTPAKIKETENKTDKFSKFFNAEEEISDYEKFFKKT